MSIDSRSEITLNIRFHGIRGDKNILQALKFSPWCLAEEAVEQVVPFFLKQDIIECKFNLLVSFIVFFYHFLCSITNFLCQPLLRRQKQII